MAKLTKRQKAIAAAIEANKVYTLEEAVQVLNSLPAAKFKESLDVAVNLVLILVNLTKLFVVRLHFLQVLVKLYVLQYLLKALLLKLLKLLVQMLLVLMILLKAFKVETLTLT
jgi:hypothetical protein